VATHKCKACNLDSQVGVVTPAGPGVCAKVGIANCHAASQQTCNLNTAQNACKDTKKCPTCKDGFLRIIATGTADDQCVAIPKIANCQTNQEACVVNSAKTGCDGAVATHKCKACNLDSQVGVVTPAGPGVCAKVGIANCHAASQQTCNLNTAQNACKDTKKCPTCKDGFLRIIATGTDNDQCVAMTAIANCATSQLSCTVNGAKTGCKADTVTCKQCNVGHFLKTVAAAADTCDTCASSASACSTVNAGCTVANGAYSDGSTCVLCSASTVEANCVQAKCGLTHLFAWNSCRPNASTDKVAGRTSLDINGAKGTCDYARADIVFQIASGSNACTLFEESTKTTEGLKTCTKCTEAACTEGSCHVSGEKLSSGKCAKPAAGGGGAGGNGTGNNTNSTASTITSAIAYAFAFVAVLLA